MSISRTSFYCLVRNVNGIAAFLPNLWCPRYCAGLCSLSHSGGLAVCSLCKWILKILILVAGIGKTCSFALLPCVYSVLFCIRRFCHFPVVVNHYFVGIRISFPWRHDVSTCIFKHRDKIWQYKTLREFVLNTLKKACTLPFPAVCSQFEIFAMALPHGNMPAV